MRQDLRTYYTVAAFSGTKLKPWDLFPSLRVLQEAEVSDDEQTWRRTLLSLGRPPDLLVETL